MTEEQKYQGALYKPKNKRVKSNPTTPAPKKDMAHAAYVEDVPDEYDAWRDYEDHDDDEDNDSQSAGDGLPEAPTPPPAGDPNVNVFDFLVANATPTASNVSLLRGSSKPSEDTQLVRYDYDANAYLDLDSETMVQYGTGPIPATDLVTPMPKADRRKIKDGEKDVKKDKKRKRLHVEILERDQVMTDAPPVLHSGLTGGINRMMSRPSVFPPSPDYSGGDAAETPASPLKKTRHSKHSKVSRTEAIGNSIMAMISSGPKTKPKKRKHLSSTTKKHHHHRHHKRLEASQEQKLLEYKSAQRDEDEDGEVDNQIIVYRPRAELFMSFINKGPESERGCSMNKALKRFHRERTTQGNSIGKLMEEKELWRSLRMKKNERGEIVLFCV